MPSAYDDAMINTTSRGGELHGYEAALEGSEPSMGLVIITIPEPPTGGGEASEQYCNLCNEVGGHTGQCWELS